MGQDEKKIHAMSNTNTSVTCVDSFLDAIQLDLNAINNFLKNDQPMRWGFYYSSTSIPRRERLALFSCRALLCRLSWTLKAVVVDGWVPVHTSRFTILKKKLERCSRNLRTHELKFLSLANHSSGDG